MSQTTHKKTEWALASYVLTDAMTDFILSRQAKLCTPRTVQWYSWTLGKFLKWLESEGVNKPEEITSRYVRGYLAELRGRELADSYIHGHARAIRTLLRFFYNEDYIPQVVKFDMPRLGKPKLLVMNAEEVGRLIKVCSNPRDKALIMFLVDTGVRRAEFCALNWDDVDLQTGLVQVRKGKGRKYRPVVMGVKTRRALLKYRRSVSNDGTDPLFKTVHGGRLTHSGMRSVLLRLGKHAGVKVNAHALRRTFATLALRGKMNIASLSRLMGHSEIKTTMGYIEMLESDLIMAHGESSPIDQLT